MTTPEPDADATIAVARALLDRCVQMEIGIDWPGGSQPLYLQSAEDVALFLKDRRLFIAKALGVEYAEYEEWYAEKAYLRCSGRKENGKPCRGFVVGVTSDPAEWVRRKRAGELCPAHSLG